jgi:thymidylate kinase
MKKVRLIVLGGFAGAGKTTIAHKLAADFNYPFVNPDDFNAGLIPHLKKEFHEVSPIAYELLWYLLKKHIEAGVTTILDANMCHERTWATLDALKEEFPELNILPIILICNLETHRERVTKRGNTDTMHLNLGGDVFEDIMFKYEFIQSLNRPDIIRVEANGSPDEVYRKVLEVLQIN